MTRTIVALSLVAAALAPSFADADGVTVTRGQFTPRLERGAPAGALDASARAVIYWFQFRNDGDPATVTLVWNVDGQPVQRQQLGLVHGRASAWGRLPRHAQRHTFEVNILDPAGATLHTDRVEVR